MFFVMYRFARTIPVTHNVLVRYGDTAKALDPSASVCVWGGGGRGLQMGLEPCLAKKTHQTDRTVKKVYIK
jgi:hypothetical protein